MAGLLEAKYFENHIRTTSRPSRMAEKTVASGHVIQESEKNRAMADTATATVKPSWKRASG
jgi:hypothetical protein